MDGARTVWSLWQSLVKEFQPQFTRGGWVHFAQWLTGSVLCPAEHTVTQILIALGIEDRWRVLESFVEYGSWDQQSIEQQLIRLVEGEQQPGWGKYRVMAVDDTKDHQLRHVIGWRHGSVRGSAACTGADRAGSGCLAGAQLGILAAHFPQHRPKTRGEEPE